MLTDDELATLRILNSNGGSAVLADSNLPDSERVAAQLSSRDFVARGEPGSGSYSITPEGAAYLADLDRAP